MNSYIYQQKNCCGTVDYKDWFATSYGNGTNVPDSCCLIVETGCGRDISKAADPSDDIITEVLLWSSNVKIKSFGVECGVIKTVKMT